MLSPKRKPNASSVYSGMRIVMSLISDAAMCPRMSGMDWYMTTPNEVRGHSMFISLVCTYTFELTYCLKCITGFGQPIVSSHTQSSSQRGAVGSVAHQADVKNLKGDEISQSTSLSLGYTYSLNLVSAFCLPAVGMTRVSLWVYLIYQHWKTWRLRRYTALDALLF